MKRVILGLFALMTAFALTSNQAFAADQQKESKKVSASQVPRASDLMDRKVKDSQGQDLGKVHDMILTRDGRISYLIVGSGGFLGLGDKYIPVPFKSAQWNPEQQVVILPNMDKNKLQNAPTVNKNDFAQLENPSFEQEVNSYYGQQQTPPIRQPQQQPQGQQPQPQQGMKQPGEGSQ